jgi:DNA-directed RNA polymerase subunit RPC12/RpoP
MNVTFACPKCDQASRVEFDQRTPQIVCTHCQQGIAVPAGAVGPDRIDRCLICPSVDLFARKDFPQRLGVAIVVTGFIASSIAWGTYHLYWTFAILFATALIDVVLYLFVGDSLMCYRCAAQYRGLDSAKQHARFDLETHERYRQERARLESMPQQNRPPSPVG